MNKDVPQHTAPAAVVRAPVQAPAVDRTRPAGHAAGSENGGGVEADFAWLLPLATKAIGAFFK
ncbi:hypothetical protein ACF09C_28995 [Streptomyces sp. NPDC014870]|uniref:hypothetical protein n=1 Tax=Streptomyces sp. NPDC014870 TaxID=3364925 RepID=UPI0036FDAEE7